MQEAVLLDTAPVAAVERVRPRKVKRPRDGRAVAFHHYQHYRIGHPLAEQAEEGAREVGHPPLAAAGRLVEGEEGVPVALLDLVTDKRRDREARVRHRPPFLADLLTLARGEAGEEVVEGAIALVEPVELDARALQEPRFAHQVELVLGGKCDVQRGDVDLVADADAGRQQGRPHRFRARSRGCEQARPGHRRERDRDLELGIVTAAGALECVRPAVVEHVFAVGMVLEIHRHGAEDGALRGLENDVSRVPAGLRRARSALFERRQKAMADERVVGARTAVPGGRVHLGDRAQNMRFDGSLARRVLRRRAVSIGLGRVARLVAGGHCHCILAPEAARSRMSVLRWISAGPSAANAPSSAGAKSSVAATVQASAPQARAAAAKSGRSSAMP